MMAWFGVIFGLILALVGAAATIGAIVTHNMDALTGCGLFAVGGFGIMMVSMDEVRA